MWHDVICLYKNIIDLRNFLKNYYHFLTNLFMTHQFIYSTLYKTVYDSIIIDFKES